jgi:hypothetical protein
MTQLQWKVLAGLKRSLEQEKKNFERDTGLVRFAGINLKPLIERHRIDIKMYEKLIADLEGK